MKLATLKDGTRDGQLVVVSRDLRTAAIADADRRERCNARSTTGPSTRRNCSIFTIR